MADAAMSEYSLIWTARRWGSEAGYGDVAAYYNYSAWTEAWASS